MTPVLVVTGPVGVGKSAVLAVADRLLVDAGIPHATIILSEIARSWPSKPDVPENDSVVYRSLAALWSNYADGGAKRLLLELLLDDPVVQLRHLHDAIPEATVTVARLHAPLATIEARLRRREPSPNEELIAARWLTARMDAWGGEDLLIESDDRSLREIATELLRAAGWLP